MVAGADLGDNSQKGRGPTSQDPDPCKQGYQSRPKNHGLIQPRAQFSRQVHGDKTGQAGRSDCRSRSDPVRKQPQQITKAI